MGVDLTVLAWLYPLVFLGMLALTLGASLFLCALVVFFSDLNYIWGVFCRLLFFLTPVFFSADIAGDGAARWLLELNPLTQLIGVARQVLLYGGPVGAGQVALALAGPVLVLLFGALVFRAARAKIPDYI
jgi:ABC-type polysaccharide/polyol phosphate export permease